MPFRRVPIVPGSSSACWRVGLSSCLARRRVITRKGGQQPPRPLLTADRQTLLDSITRQYDAIHDFNATVDMVPALGTAEKSKITEYKDVRAYILFRKPADIRIIGLYPGGAHQGLRHGLERRRFQALPALTQSLSGRQERDRAAFRRTSWRICGRSIFWTPCWCAPSISKTEKVLLENFTDEDNAFYILHVVHENGNGQLQLSRSIWFNRSTCSIARQLIFDDDGNILTDARYTEWKTYDNVPFPKHIEINRPRDEYAVVIDIVKMDINKGVSQDKFVLEQPEGSTLQVVGQTPPLRPPPPAPAHQRKSQEKVTGKLVLENLKHRPMRSLLSILLIGVPVTLILCLVGLSHGMIEDSQKRARGIGADIMMRAATRSRCSRSAHPSPSELVDYFAKQPHVKIATGVVNATDRRRATRRQAASIWSEFNAMSGGFKFLEGGPFQGPDDVIIDRLSTPSRRRSTLGDTIKLLNRDLARLRHHRGRQTGAHRGAARHAAGTETGNTARSARSISSWTTRRTPTRSSRTCRQIAGPKVTRSSRMEEFTSAAQREQHSRRCKAFIIVIIGIGVVIGFAVVCLSMYMAVLQRTREIGILKSRWAARRASSCASF